MDTYSAELYGRLFLGKVVSLTISETLLLGIPQDRLEHTKTPGVAGLAQSLYEPYSHQMVFSASVLGRLFLVLHFLLSSFILPSNKPLLE